MNPNEPAYSIGESELKVPDVRIKGNLDEGDLRLIYDGILKSKYYSKKQLMDIHSSLNSIGITGLKKP